MARDTLVTGAKVRAVADALRARLGTDAAMTLDEIAEAIAAMPEGDGGEDRLIAGTVRGAYSSDVQRPRAFAFAFCREMTSLDLPNAEVLYEGAVAGCASLESLRVPNLSTIYGNPFSKTYSGSAMAAPVPLKVLDLPRVTSIRNRLYVPPFLERLRLGGLVNMSMPASDYGIYYDPLSFKSTRLHVCLPAAQSIYSYSSTYAPFNVPSCVEEIAFHLPALASVKNGAFYGCACLSSLYLPSLRTISGTAFSGCKSLSAIVLPGDRVCELAYRDAFWNSSVAEGTGYVYVPRALLGDYEEGTNWSNISSQLRAIEDWPDEVAAARALSDAAGDGWD